MEQSIWNHEEKSIYGSEQLLKEAIVAFVLMTIYAMSALANDINDELYRLVSPATCSYSSS